MNQNVKKYLVFLTIVLTFGIFLIFLLEKICISVYNEDAGMNLPYQGGRISTKFSRKFHVKKKCNMGKPCHVYPTLADEANTKVILNVHTHEDIKNIYIQYVEEEYYKENKQFLYSIQQMDQIIKIDIESQADRNVHQVLVSQLIPDTSYIFAIRYTQDDVNKYIYKYRTFNPNMPKGQKFTFAAGGDVSTSDIAKQMTNTIANYKPQIIFLGGDIAYDDGQTYCYFALDAYLDMMELFTKVNDNYMVPIVYAVGNHDIGLNSYPESTFTKGNLTPLFIQYFAQGFSDLKVPPIQSRRLYHSIQFANMIMYSLDVGYIDPVGSNQQNWLESHMSNNRDKLKFAQYHDPTYPSCIREDEDLFHQVETLVKWNPIFDKYGLMAAFENHEHLFKFSRKIKGSQEHENGTFYLGDGCWGADINDCVMNKDYRLFQAVDRKYNVYIVDVYVKEKVVYTAYDHQNQFLFQDYQLIQNYVI